MKYDCKDCEHSRTGSAGKKNRYCKNCTVSSKDIYGKPTHYKEKYGDEQQTGISASHDFASKT